jgi:DNA-binding Lrp family transcriptional regulator
VALSDFDKQAVRITQDDLPLVEEPFAAACDALSCDFDTLRAWFADMKGKGVLRRFAAILRHRSAGFVANGMVTWIVPAQHIEQAGKLAGQFEAVSHCYQRPAYDDWPYNLYTMVHARTKESCEQTVAEIAAALAPLAVTTHRTLYSTHEYKKARVRYFED